MKTVETKILPAATPGTTHFLNIVRFGRPGSRPKAYLQAGLHADEAPSFVALHHLCRKLDAAADNGQIIGEIVVIPVANPIGLSQWRDDLLQGRFDFSNSINFNRQHIDLVEQVSQEIEPLLGPNSQQNTTIVRNAMRKVLAAIRPDDEAGHLKHLLMSLSQDADIVLDLHCDHQALLHVYLGTPLWPQGSDLPAQLGAEVTLLASDSGGTPFDEANSRPWWNLAERFPQHPLPTACLAATVELRGICDTAPHLAEQDAGNLFTFLQRRGCIAGQPPPIPELRGEATPLTGVDYIKAPSPGIIAFLKEPGDWVRQNEQIAEIINPLCADGSTPITPVISNTEGRFFARIADRFARTGRIIAKIAGRKPLRSDQGNLLTS